VLETARTARSSSTVAAPIAAASPRPARVATSRPHTAARSFGTLAIQATPWAELTIDGVTEGLTPFYRRVSAGTHRIVLVHRPTGRRAIRAVRVRPETVTRIEVDLR
jgi:hypothetical protein